MRKLLLAAAAGATALGGVMIAQAVQAQPYYVAPAPVYAAPPAGYHYDAYGRLVYDPAYVAPPVVAGAVLGPPLAAIGAAVPFDQYGPDPNGMIAADGHKIKCKLTDDWDGRFDRYMTHRVCY
jgi:hypothetical protein